MLYKMRSVNLTVLRIQNQFYALQNEVCRDLNKSYDVEYRHRPVRRLLKRSGGGSNLRVFTKGE